MKTRTTGHGLQEGRGEAALPKGAVKDTFGSLHLQVGHHLVALGLQELGRSLSRGEAQRAHVHLGISLGVLDLHERQEDDAPGHGDGNRVQDLDSLDAAGLSSEPAPRLEEGREDLLDLSFAPPLEDVRPDGLDRHLRQDPLCTSRFLLQYRRPALLQCKPVVGVRGQGEQVRELANAGEVRLAEELHRDHLLKLGEIQLHELGVAGEVGHHQDPLVPVAPDVGQDLGVGRMEELQAPLPESAEALPEGHEPLHPPEEGVGIVELGLHVHGFVGEVRIDDRGQEEALGVGPGEAGVAVGAPLHGRAHPVPVTQIDVVPHADLVAVVDDRRPRGATGEGRSSARCGGGRFPEGVPAGGGSPD